MHPQASRHSDHPSPLSAGVEGATRRSVASRLGEVETAPYVPEGTSDITRHKDFCCMVYGCDNPASSHLISKITRDSHIFPVRSSAI